MEIIDEAGNIRLWATGPTTLRFDTSGLYDPATYKAVPDVSAVSWKIVAGDRFTLALERDDENTSVFWFRFTEAHSISLGRNVHTFELLADFGAGWTTVTVGKISAARSA